MGADGRAHHPLHHPRRRYLPQRQDGGCRGLQGFPGARPERKRPGRHQVSGGEHQRRGPGPHHQNQTSLPDPSEHAGRYGLYHRGRRGGETGGARLQIQAHLHRGLQGGELFSANRPGAERPPGSLEGQTQSGPGERQVHLRRQEPVHGPAVRGAGFRGPDHAGRSAPFCRRTPSCRY